MFFNTSSFSSLVRSVLVYSCVLPVALWRIKECKVGPRPLQLGTGLEKAFRHSGLGCVSRDNLCCQALLCLAGSISFFNSTLKNSYSYDAVATGKSRSCYQLLHVGAAGFDHQEVTRGVILSVGRAHTRGWLPRHAVCLLKWREWCLNGGLKLSSPWLKKKSTQWTLKT